jgi:hypothetical protein
VLLTLVVVLTRTAIFLATTPIANADEPDTETYVIERYDGTTEQVEKSEQGLPPTLSKNISATANCTAPAPTLLTPAEGTISNDLENPPYTWTVVPGITEYFFELASDENFTDILEIDNRVISATDTQVRFFSFHDLEPETTYFWRVASVCSNGQIGVFSEPFSLQTGAGAGGNCTLSPPTLLIPANGAQVNSLVPNIEWQRKPNVYEYHYQLALNSAFTSTVDSVTFFGINPEVLGNIVERPDENLLPNTLYYWRVASICAEIDTMGGYSAPFTFRSGPGGGTFLPPPSLIAPADKATTGSLRVTFQYTEIANAEQYSIHIYSSQEAAEADSWRQTHSTANTTRVAVFGPEETVFWRVTTRNNYGWGNLSAIRSFVTPSISATTTINPQTGGTLKPTAGFLTVTFPPNTVNSETEVNFRLLSTPQQRLPNFLFANRAFVLEAFSGGNEVTHFLQPYKMIIRYDASDLLAAGIIDATQLNLLFWNGDEWETVLPCQGCVVDPANLTVTVILDHFTEFALAAPNINKVYLPLLRK